MISLKYLNLGRFICKSNFEIKTCSFIFGFSVKHMLIELDSLLRVIKCK